MSLIALLKKHKLEIFNLFFTLLFGLLTFLYFEGLNWVGYRAYQTLTTLNFYLETICLLLLDAGYIFYAVKYNKIRICWPFLIILLVFCVFAMVPLIGFPGSLYEGKIVYELNNELRTRYMFLTFMAFLSIFIFIVVIPQILRERKLYKLFFAITVGVGLFATIYSYITEGEIYSVLFSNPHAYTNVPQSYTTNRNVYAYICIMAMLSEAYLLIDEDRPWHWALFFYFFINACFTFSKTCILLGLLIAAAFSIYKIVLMWKKKLSVSIGLIIGITIASAFVLFISLTEFEGFLGKIHSFTNYLLFELPKLNEGSLESRSYYFDAANLVLSKTTFTRIFGFGYGNWNASYFAAFMGDSTYYQPMDIAYAVDMFEFGFPGLVFSIGLWGLAIYLVVLSFKHKSKYSFISSLMLLCFLLRTVTEAGDFTHPNLTGTIYYLLLMCPMISENIAVLHKKNITEPGYLKEISLDYKPIINQLIGSLSVILSVLMVCLAFRAKTSVSTLFLIISIVLGLFAFIVPLAPFFMPKKENEKTTIETVYYVLASTFAIFLWLIAVIVLRNNKTNLDGMTYLQVCLLPVIVCFILNSLIVIESSNRRLSLNKGVQN